MTTKTVDERFVFEDGYQDFPHETDRVCVVVAKTLNITNHAVVDGVLVDQTAEREAARAVAQAEAEMEVYARALDDHLNAEAVKLGYDDIKSAVTYADEPAVLKFQDEGRALRAWRSVCYEAGYVAINADPAPTLEEFISGLPILTVTYS